MTVDDPAELERRFSAYTAEVEDHGRRWWANDPGVQSMIAADPAMLDRLLIQARSGDPVQTSDVYADANDNWASSRTALQDERLRSIYGIFVPAVDRPFVVYLLGLPGSGKTSVLRPLAREFLQHEVGGGDYVRDADDTESAYVTYVRADRLLPRDRHLLVDLVGDPRWLSSEMERFASRGYRLIALCTEVPLEVAVGRVKQRALADGRHVDIDYLRTCDGRSRRALEQALDDHVPIEHWAIIDTSGEDPIVLDGDGRFGQTGKRASGR